jgi:hypothetical protein
MTTAAPRDALAALLRALPTCEGYGGNSCRKPATHSYNDGRRACAKCAEAQNPDDPEDGPIVASPLSCLEAIKAAEAALAAPPLEVVIEREADPPPELVGRHSVRVGNGMPIGCSEQAANVAASVAEALGARVVRK